MLVINLASYLYKTSVATSIGANGQSTLKHFIFPSFQKERKKVKISKDDFNLLIKHPNFKYRLDNGLLRIDSSIGEAKIVETPKEALAVDDDEAISDIKEAKTVQRGRHRKQ